MEPERVTLRSLTDLARLEADLRLGRCATAFDVRGRRMRLSDGEGIGFDGLLIATGVAPRRLPGSDLAGVHVLRTLDDALALRAALLAGPRVVAVGAGFLGTEVAAAARTLSLQVTVVEPEPVPLRRPFGDRIGALVADLHRDHGTRLRCGVPVRRLRDTGGRVTGVELGDGTTLSVDVVILAVGSVPATGCLRGSGLSLDDGVVCDALCQAAPGIYAAGDVASWHNPRFGTRMRTEHRMNAAQQAMAAVGNLLGDAVPFAPVPYFWTDQYDTRIQAYGIFPRGAELRIVHRDPSNGHFTAAYGHHGAVVGVLGDITLMSRLSPHLNATEPSIRWAAATASARIGSAEDSTGLGTGLTGHVTAEPTAATADTPKPDIDHNEGDIPGYVSRSFPSLADRVCIVMVKAGDGDGLNGVCVASHGPSCCVSGSPARTRPGARTSK
ncbi:FAD/NAD(P)-binding oxidoreductase [Streptomyces sp. NPDC052036]|uniref:NAD(P)/FAD-dependent oxidoreductase n=1 Tax=Streptomyces sp. NPDC052036 TaxID=3155171 RepID=UPI0034136FCE